MLVEVCANSLQSAINAEKAGASRIELCMELGVGGVTPSYGLLKSVKDQITIPVHVLIRPRGGDFVFTANEFNCMLNDIELCRSLGFEGVVSGVLTEDFELDINRTSKLIEASKGMKFTFYRAFDWVTNPKKTLKELDNLKVDFLLTSGQERSAFTGLPLLKELRNEAKFVTVMPGSGVSLENAKIFKKKGFSIVHLSGVSFKEKNIPSTKISMYTPSFLKDDLILETSIKKVSAIVTSVK